MGRKQIPKPEGGTDLRFVLCLVVILATLCTSCQASPELRINIPEYTLVLLDKGQVVKKYEIAVGTPYEQTPTGSFAVFLKLENPVWYPGAKFTDRTPVPPGPDNPLGSRWMEFHPTFGIHGTNLDWSISYPVSGGCIRMHDKDARELYEIVGIGTPVTIVYETLQVTEKSDGLYLKVWPDIYGRKTSSQERYQELLAPHEVTYRITRPPVFPLREADDAYELKVGQKMAGPATTAPQGAPPRPSAPPLQPAR